MKAILVTAALLAAAPAVLHAEEKKEAPAAAPATTETVIENVDAAKAAKLLEEGAKTKGSEITIIDVRTPDEFATSHLKGAKNLDISGPDFQTEVGKLDKEKPILVHCQAGGRSTRSLEVFKKQGFTRVIHLDGGLAAWKKAGLPVEKPAAK